MRCFTILPLLFAAGCSNAPQQQAVAPNAAELMESGQWHVESEVTALRSTDKSTPALKIPVGTTASHDACVPEADRKKPAPVLFTGKDYSCKYDNLYVSNGLINGSLSCTKPGLSGQVLMSVDGSYTATSFDAELSMTSYLSGSGDFASTAKLAGKRTGACA
jgi:hypothetical protein